LFFVSFEREVRDARLVFMKELVRQMLAVGLGVIFLVWVVLALTRLNPEGKTLIQITHHLDGRSRSVEDFAYLINQALAEKQDISFRVNLVGSENDVDLWKFGEKVEVKIHKAGDQRDAKALAKNLLDDFDYFIFIDEKSVGPFFPSFLPESWHWSKGFIDNLKKGWEIVAVSSRLGVFGASKEGLMKKNPAEIYYLTPEGRQFYDGDPFGEIEELVYNPLESLFVEIPALESGKKPLVLNQYMKWAEDEGKVVPQNQDVQAGEKLLICAIMQPSSGQTLELERFLQGWGGHDFDLHLMICDENLEQLSEQTMSKNDNLFFQRASKGSRVENFDYCAQFCPSETTFLVWAGSAFLDLKNEFFKKLTPYIFSQLTCFEKNIKDVNNFCNLEYSFWNYQKVLNSGLKFSDFSDEEGAVKIKMDGLQKKGWIAEIIR
jgi:hypothetical protein